MTTVNSMIWSMNIKYFQFLHILMIAGMIELSSSNAVLSITDDKWQINCGSSVVLNCTLQNVPSIVMSWQLNGILAADCDSSICYPPSGMPSHYVTTVGNGTLYHLTINPVKLTDNYTISCTDGTGSSPINTTVRVPVKPSEFTVSKDVQSNKTVITVLTNCIFAPMESLRFKLQYQKGSNENVSYINDFHPNEVIDCSYVDNPDCGGNSTGRAKANMTIDTAQTGTTYFFKLVVFQSNTQFPAIDIGNYILPATCNSNQIMCDTTKLCVNKCDDNNDCDDGSDEENCEETTQNWASIGVGSAGGICVVAAGGVGAHSYKNRKKDDGENEYTEDV